MKRYLFEQKIYVFEADGSQDHLIPQGARLLADEEVAAIRAPTPDQRRAMIQGSIEALERRELLARVVREGMLAAAEEKAIEIGAEQGLTPDQALAALRANPNTGYYKMRALDAEIAVLRAQLKQ